ncbi:MAG: single-stranded-DNA-specific exonuclease RecJ [Blautia sp.]|nr:single-stranded-DNA-specific exonuclease RecJ [Blautia sp.]
MEKWVLTAKRADFAGIGKKFGIDQVIARLIRNRDVVEEEEIRKYLYGGLEDLPSPWLLKDMEKAVEILEKKIHDHVKIRIIGDYDIDGVTSTYILLKGLKRVGAEVDTYIPDRVADGYGIRAHLIEKAAEDGVDTIVTCDNGIAAAQEIQTAKEKGLTVIITDHHEIPYRETENGRELILPLADAVINPKQPDCCYPNKKICGAVVAFKLITALYDRFGISETELEDYLELAAIATVGDVMDLQGENRILVKEGLKRLAETKNKGLRALIQANGLDGGRITSYHVGFVLGPCINASGRLDTAARSLALLNAEDEDEAARLAGDLTALNESRKALTEKGKEAAIEQVETTELKNDRVLVVYLPDCHESLAGIIAGRIREKYNKPSFVLTKGETCVKGSGRSIEGYSMFEELVKCAELMVQFGGHPMAAGLSVEEKNVELLRRRLNENCTLTEEDLRPKVTIDVPMPISYITKNLVEEISLLEPFGKGNTKPLFAQKNLRVLESRILGKNRNVAKLRLMDETSAVIDGMYFGEAEEFIRFAKSRETISVTYYPEINRYMGKENLQIVIQNYC